MAPRTIMTDRTTCSTSTQFRCLDVLVLAALFMIISTVTGFQQVPLVSSSQRLPSKSRLLVFKKKPNNPAPSQPKQNAAPGTELFPGQGPYVPSGLSAEEYAKIKQQEAARLEKMNFAAWGPRFQRSEAPRGDWMVMPSLWTNGFGMQPQEKSQRQRQMQRQQSTSSNPIPGRPSPKWPAITMGYMLVFSLKLAIDIWQRQLLLFSKMGWKVGLKQCAILSLGAFATTPLMDRIRQWTNRKRLWGTGKILRVTSLTCIGTLGLWALLLRAIREVAAMVGLV